MQAPRRLLPLLAIEVATAATVVDVGMVRIQLCTPEIVRVLAFHTPAAEHVANTSSLVVVNPWIEDVPHNVTKDATGATEITTDALKVVVCPSGNVSFFSMDGSPMLAEKGREFAEASVTQEWDSPPSESLYGLGHFNYGLIDFRLAPVDMTQWNLWKIVPFLVSTRGWGVLWDTSYATAHFNRVTDEESVPLGAWTVRPVATSDPAPTRAYNTTPTNWSQASGNVTVTEAGSHWVYMQMPTLIWCSHGARVRIGSEIVIDLFDDPCNLPPSTLGRVTLQPGTHTITVETWAQNKFEPTIWVRGPRYGNKTSWQSDRPASSVDYYFMAGGSIARSIALYREATGPAPMPPRAIFGFMHSKDRFKNQSSLLTAAAGFRKGRYPVDTIVQDWFFWPKTQTGYVNYGFDPARYPDPPKMTAQLHEWNMHFMVTYWPQVDGPLKSELAKTTPPALIGSVCDQYNPTGREIYYEYANVTKYSMGVDFSWLDSCDVQPNGPNYLGDGADFAMTYGLMETTAIHDGYVRDWGNSRRMFALPRSSYAGMQRTGASMWSGDISGTWDSLRRSVAGSINYQLSGNALWSMDTGGYFHALDELTNDNYRELLVRWHQFACWTPVLRQHGRKGAQTTPAGGAEYYIFGGNTTAAIKAAHQLRYRLLPFIYSIFATEVSSVGAGTAIQSVGTSPTLQRALAMEFPSDLAVRQTADSFLFGSSFLVFPVLQYQEKTHTCYFPTRGTAGTNADREEEQFVNFWTGEVHTSGSTISTPVVLERIPLFVRSGSIVPMGPHLQFAAEKPSDPLELRVYAGSSAKFILYEDDGTTMHYIRRNESSTITIEWDDGTRTLTIAARVGRFPGMLQNRTLNVVLVSKGFGVGMEPTAKPTQVLAYTGTPLSVKL